MLFVDLRTFTHEWTLKGQQDWWKWKLNLRTRDAGWWDVSDNRSFQPPCRCTASTQHSHHHQSTAGWWKTACRAHSTASRCLGSASGRWWWTGRWRGWSDSCSDPGGRSRTLCSDKRCSHGETRSSPTSRSPRSLHTEAGAGRAWTGLPLCCSLGSEQCGRIRLTLGFGRGRRWRWPRGDLEEK